MKATDEYVCGTEQYVFVTVCVLQDGSTCNF